VKGLRKFARALSWPNFVEVDEVLKGKDRKTLPLEERSSDSMSYFSGMILPGVTLPFLLMNSILDCDGDDGTRHLTAISHIYPQCGFQYRSTTYWTSSCIVGKVLAPSCREVAGWIGPVMSSPDLQRVEIGRIRQRCSRQRTRPSEVQSMAVRSDPLGPSPPTNLFPVVEYQIVMPDLENVPDTVRVEKLALVPVLQKEKVDKKHISTPRLFDASVQFAIDGKSWPVRLSFDVSYISAYPCLGGPHPLFYDYIYKAIKTDEILSIKEWGNLSDHAVGTSTSDLGRRKYDDDLERVLVVEAFGSPDNEILARAWASHWGHSAIVANVQRTW
jgi:hypothetical protein